MSENVKQAANLSISRQVPNSKFNGILLKKKHKSYKKAQILWFLHY